MKEKARWEGMTDCTWAEYVAEGAEGRLATRLRTRRGARGAGRGCPPTGAHRALPARPAAAAAYDGQQLRVEEELRVGHAHGQDQLALEGALVRRDVRPAEQHAAFEQAVHVHGQHLHGVRQDELERKGPFQTRPAPPPPATPAQPSPQVRDAAGSEAGVRPDGAPAKHPGAPRSTGHSRPAPAAWVAGQTRLAPFLVSSPHGRRRRTHAGTMGLLEGDAATVWEARGACQAHRKATATPIGWGRQTRGTLTCTAASYLPTLGVGWGATGHDTLL